MNNRWQGLKPRFGLMQFLDLMRYDLAQAYRELGKQVLEPLGLGLVSQQDNVGCQAGLYQYISRGVQLWYTEKDADRESGSRFDLHRVATFRLEPGNPGDWHHTFIYPNLLLMPAFSWRNDGHIQDVDTLFLCQVETNEMKIWLGAEPARREDVSQRTIQKI
jgi:hypothetical protein